MASSMAEQFIREQTRKKHKFNAKRTVVDGKHFPSALEASVYCLCKLMVKNDGYSDLQLQDSVSMTLAHITWKVDFRLTDPNGAYEWHEAKGVETNDYVLKKRLWKHYGPGVLVVWKGTAARPVIVETVIPKI